jgi:hypothetical protein
MHLRGRFGPSRTRPPCRPNNKPARLGLELHLFRELRLLQQCLGHANASRIADPNNPRDGRHGDHIVITPAVFVKSVVQQASARPKPRAPQSSYDYSERVGFRPLLDRVRHL